MAAARSDSRSNKKARREAPPLLPSPSNVERERYRDCGEGTVITATRRMEDSIQSDSRRGRNGDGNDCHCCHFLRALKSGVGCLPLANPPATSNESSALPVLPDLLNGIGKIFDQGSIDPFRGGGGGAESEYEKSLASKLFEVMEKSRLGRRQLAEDSDPARKGVEGGLRLDSAAGPPGHVEDRETRHFIRRLPISPAPSPSPFPKYLIPKRLELSMDYKPIYYFPVLSPVPRRNHRLRRAVC